MKVSATSALFGGVSLLLLAAGVSAAPGPVSIDVSSRVEMVADKLVKLNGQEVAAAYVGKTVTSRQHSTKYKKNGTWVNKDGLKGKYSISKSGILTMTGDLNLRLEVFRSGKGYYNRGVGSSGRGTYYTAN